MATIVTHGFVGLGLGKVYSTRRMGVLFWVLAFLLPMVPDCDVFGMFWNIAYDGSPLSHRGFTHSIVFACALGLLVAGLTIRYFRVRFWPLWLFFSAIIASHGVFDALTNGGYGVAFFWPVDSTRYGPGWGPIQVADMGFEIPDFRTSRTVHTELLWVWLPTALTVNLVMSYRYWKSCKSFASRTAERSLTPPAQ